MFYVFLGIGTAAMLVCMWYGAKPCHIPFWKTAVLSVMLTAIGVLGAHVMSWIESGTFSGRSFFGAVFLVPPLMILVAKVIRVDYAKALDLCAPAECIMLSLLKVKCRIDGCCYGRIFFIANRGFRFPSQIVECIAGLLIMAILLAILSKGRKKGIVYPWYLVIYGGTRFLLNLFRETTPWIGPLPAGNVWALVAVIVGVIALALIRPKVPAKDCQP